MGNRKTRNCKHKGSSEVQFRWIIKIVLWTIIISSTVNFLSEVLLKNAKILVAFIILIIIIFIGITFDIIGVSVTAANEMPFHSMASKRLSGAKIAIKLIRNADKVSSFCNDVIGDVCGIISGSAGAIIVSKIISGTTKIFDIIITVSIGALIAAFTVAGKAIGKNYAINNSNEIILKVSKVIYFFKKER